LSLCFRAPRYFTDILLMAMSQRVMSLYRCFLREARLMPTKSRREFVIKKVGVELRHHRSISDPEQIRFHLELMVGCMMRCMAGAGTKGVHRALMVELQFSSRYSACYRCIELAIHIPRYIPLISNMHLCYVSYMNISMLSIGHIPVGGAT